ncbi:1,6-anhydro-N-acetylmuramyl-L-alanine amidase AmpD [Chitinilyticum piscinae]|uniref:1,6-anhydro-N-acetylmuramyl-L-alanine amidase AmpD n=1 Tax=Chitinilyticum piscinae TaxID=2866724 RepID=A0A8J7K0Z4_9NEIS|nr:1,6-anhydro-N-acetylmuramyl-L-alanine amidase AmpD [Chitinilyticum piscinae]MBE9607852.1 1,6-anhydro-N-acetylmuramyl-L-alanine amidase AmpD [Chitinilyticum piscinae]
MAELAEWLQQHAPCGYEIDVAGWCVAARRVASPNCNARPASSEVELVVLHNIHLPPGKPFAGHDVEHLFTNTLDRSAHPSYPQLAELRVSAHFFLRRDGCLLQFVPTTARAWHAGVSSWQGRPGCNDFSVGIELEGSDFIAFEPIQYAVLDMLLAALCKRHPVVAIAGHSDVAPGRKTDPGPWFDWRRVRTGLQEGHVRVAGGEQNSAPAAELRPDGASPQQST